MSKKCESKFFAYYVWAKTEDNTRIFILNRLREKDEYKIISFIEMFNAQSVICKLNF